MCEKWFYLFEPFDNCLYTKALFNKDKINLAFSRSFEKHVCQVLYLLKEDKPSK